MFFLVLYDAYYKNSFIFLPKLFKIMTDTTPVTWGRKVHLIKTTLVSSYTTKSGMWYGATYYKTKLQLLLLYFKADEI